MKDGEERYLQLARDRSAEWVIEWRCAKGELNEEIERDRKRVKLPTISEEAKGKWRRMEKPTDVKELIFIEEVTESLKLPVPGRRKPWGSGGRGWMSGITC